MKGYLWNLLIALDQGLNALLGGAPDETMSSRMGRAVAEKDGDTTDDDIARATCKVLDVIDKDHCADSVEFTPEGKPDPHHLDPERPRT